MNKDIFNEMKLCWSEYKIRYIATNVHSRLSELLSDPQASSLSKSWAIISLLKFSRDDANQPTLVTAGIHIQLRDFLIDLPLRSAPEMDETEARLAEQSAAIVLCNLSNDSDKCTTLS